MRDLSLGGEERPLNGASATFTLVLPSASPTGRELAPKIC